MCNVALAFRYFVGVHFWLVRLLFINLYVFQILFFLYVALSIFVSSEGRRKDISKLNLQGTIFFFFAPSPLFLFRRQFKAFRKHCRNFSQVSFAVSTETTKNNGKHLFFNTYKTNSVVIIHFQVPGHWQLLPKRRFHLSSGIQYSRTDSENCL